jgi:hypothetical protein
MKAAKMGLLWVGMREFLKAMKKVERMVMQMVEQLGFGKALKLAALLDT